MNLIQQVSEVAVVIGTMIIANPISNQIIIAEGKFPNKQICHVMSARLIKDIHRTGFSQRANTYSYTCEVIGSDI